MGCKILVYWQITEEQKQKICAIADKHGCTTCFTTDLKVAEAEAEDADIMFGADSGPLREAKQLKWFCSFWAGVNHYLENGVLPNNSCLLSNSSGAYGVSISEHIIMTALLMMRQFGAYEKIMSDVTTKEWRHDLPMHSLCGSRITVLGTGDIGSTFAKRVRGFDPEAVIGVSRSGSRAPEYDEVWKVTDLESVLPETDLLVMSLPETPETIGLLSRKMIALLPENAYLVNVGRGSAIDEEALVDALNEGKLAGASLDVMQTEPVPADSPLRTAKNILLTPHCAGQMTLDYTREKSVAMFCEDLENYLSGRPLSYGVNKERGY
ncbi:MAG: D-2-hydroxyacid dehydrogenase [Bilifractor sp.]|jgi:phosphoglycerate dehydrogenase-like enzyme